MFKALLWKKIFWEGVAFSLLIQNRWCYTEHKLVEWPCAKAKIWSTSIQLWRKGSSAWVSSERHALESVHRCDGNKEWLTWGVVGLPSCSPSLSVFMARELGTAAWDDRNMSLYSVYWIYTVLNVIVSITNTLWTPLPEQAQMEPCDIRVKEVRGWSQTSL